MLLHELYETKKCNTMLFPESDAEIWKHEDVQISVSPLGVHISKGDSKGSVTPMGPLQLRMTCPKSGLLEGTLR